MINFLLNAWAYWDWFLIRQHPKGPDYDIRNPISRGVLAAIIPSIGCVAIFVILFRTLFASMPITTKKTIMWVFAIIILGIAVAGTHRRSIKMREFENYEPQRVKKYDALVWVSVIFCIILLISAMILSNFISASGQWIN